MEIKTKVVIPVLVGTFLLLQTLAVPVIGQVPDEDISADKRPKYMDTRDLQDAFKNLILSSLQQLVVDGKLSPVVLPDEDSKGVQSEKRGRQGLCWRRSNGRVRPFFCWRGNSQTGDDSKRGQQGLCYKRISQNRVMPYLCWKNNK